jgi:hypothetical protein
VPLRQVGGDVAELGREVLVDEQDVHWSSFKFQVESFKFALGPPLNLKHGT